MVLSILGDSLSMDVAWVWWEHILPALILLPKGYISVKAYEISKLKKLTQGSISQVLHDMYSGASPLRIPNLHRAFIVSGYESDH